MLSEEVGMKKVQTITVIAGLLFSLTASVENMISNRACTHEE